ncbi:NADH dehydrogenase [Massilia sp. WF1]|uniref:complex I subunit 1 family protein n=1 Tax=Massilia TaxID=149698 RepID=UPI00064ACBE7|nr:MULTISPECIES: complex I subunit 1 family protein [Massilia]ALK97746.1 NADH dehydrogenase [Massilia sp. WG5]KLU35198.1 NADH dehydrogenase [Massilia sp. WF1]
MGIAGKTLLVTLALLAGAWVSGRIERVLMRGEPGAMHQAGTAAVHLGRRDRWLYPIGPAVALAAVLLGAVVMPFGPALVGEDLQIGVFYFIVVIDFAVLGIALSGWGANTGHAVEACYRAVAQLVAYVVPLGMAVVGTIMMAKSLSTTRIVEAQQGVWFIVLQPLGFALYLVTGLMQCYRAPFLEPFADSVVGGVLGVSTGPEALIWRLALSGLLLLVAAMGAVLFLGGWSGPWLPAPLWMALKTLGLMILMLAGGRMVRPLSVARMLGLSWKVLIPLGLANVLLVGGLILLKIGPTG